MIESFIAGREALTSRVYNVAPEMTELEIELLKGQSIAIRLWKLTAISADRLAS